MTDGQDQVYAAQIVHLVERIRTIWNKDAERLRTVSKDCQCHRRTYSLDGHASVLINELLRIANEQLDDIGGDIRVRSWTELGRENDRLRASIRSLRSSASHIVEIADL